MEYLRIIDFLWIINANMFFWNNVFGDPEEFDDPQVSDCLKVISRECVDFDDSKEFDDPKVFDDPKGISIESVDFDNPKV